MKHCKIIITTAVDGQENTITREGTLSLETTRASLVYREENATISLRLYEEQAELKREGDYSLYLMLNKDKSSEGKIGIGGSDGNIIVYTHRVAYSITKNSLLASLKYDLLFGKEKQEMSVRILARYEDRENI